MMNKNTKSAFR